MMSTTRTVKTNFTIPEDVILSLKDRVSARQRSGFVAAAIRERLNQLQQEELRQALIEGYLARKEEDAAIKTEWEEATLERWP